MKVVIGIYYKTLRKAVNRAEEMKRLWKGRVAFVVVGSKEKGYIVISEGAARASGLKVPKTARKYAK